MTLFRALVLFLFIVVLPFLTGKVGYGMAEEKYNVTNSEGGAETEVQKPDPTFQPGFDFLFPIHEDNFLFYTSMYGIRVSPILHIERHHTGVDIASTYRAQVVSVADGKVVDHWPPPDGYYKGHRVHGGYIVIEHANGVQSHYSHLSWTRIHTGMEVKAGEVIGRTGRTGMATGNHLHFELHINGSDIDPLLYIPNPKEIPYSEWK